MKQKRMIVELEKDELISVLGGGWIKTMVIEDGVPVLRLVYV